MRSIAKSSDCSQQVVDVKQLRGIALEHRIEVAIRKLASDSQLSSKKYVYNASHIAREVPTTRKTLAKYNELVTRVLNDLDARRRMVTGNVMLTQMQAQIEFLKGQIAEREKTIFGLRAHHIEIYKRFHDHSMEADILFGPLMKNENNDATECVFCGSKLLRQSDSELP